MILEEEKPLSYSGKFHFVFSFCLLTQILTGLSALSHLTTPKIPTPGLLGQANTAARGLRSLKNHSVHEELSVSAKCNFLKNTKLFSLKNSFTLNRDLNLNFFLQKG